MEQLAGNKLATEPKPPIQHGKKSAWPLLLGKPATLATHVIAHDRPDVAVEVLPPGSHVSAGYNALRVRFHIDGLGFVAEIPVIG